MQSSKPLEFHGKAGGYFLLTIISIIMVYIPFFGWAFLLNYAAGWFADNALVNGQKVEYEAGYGETLKFVFVNALLIIITFGIYSFWFYPKVYRYMADHTNYLNDGAVPQAPAIPVPAAPEQFVAPVSPVAPIAPSAVVPDVAPVLTPEQPIVAPVATVPQDPSITPPATPLV
jgi:hypothetical protein